MMGSLISNSPNGYYVDSHDNLQNNLRFSIINILCKDVVNIIIDYSNVPILLNWIDVNKLDIDNLSRNPNAMGILEKHPEKIDWDQLSANPNAIHLLEKHPEKIDWHWLSANPNAMGILEKHPKKIDWGWLSANPNAMEILE